MTVNAASEAGSIDMQDKVTTVIDVEPTTSDQLGRAFSIITNKGQKQEITYSNLSIQHNYYLFDEHGNHIATATKVSDLSKTWFFWLLGPNEELVSRGSNDEFAVTDPSGELIGILSGSAFHPEQEGNEVSIESIFPNTTHLALGAIEESTDIKPTSLSLHPSDNGQHPVLHGIAVQNGEHWKALFKDNMIDHRLVKIAFAILTDYAQTEAPAA